MITKFNSIISDLRKTLKYESVNKLRDFTGYYENVGVLIVISFLAGIGTLIITPYWSGGFLLAFFMFLNLSFIISINIYQVFKNSLSKKKILTRISKL
ncbi:hypothetical protein ASJ81_13550 [Methanosarcina spelaei]|uniref:Uncharacterized protein n=1 Tax=Methanosarcina spelaei TaxID=1036679 RepID=A0A2A2HYH5_9EURY|nr:hypothetical protein ASJ81_13550 [Methanosarcina spelaei]